MGRITWQMMGAGVEKMKRASEQKCTYSAPVLFCLMLR